MVRFFLNNQLFNNPRDWDGFSTEFKRDYDKRIISVQYTDRVTFTLAAHDYIKSIQDADGYCAEIDLRVEEQCGNGPWIVIARGKVIMADCEWNETKCSVQCSVVDNGIGARVANNKKVPVSPISTLSKNDAVIDPAIGIDLEMFLASGGYATGTRRVFDWFDSIEQALAYITDGTVSITSSWYDGLPDDEKLAVAAVPDLRTAGFEVPRIAWTFDDLFTEISKKYNLWMFPVEDFSGNATILLEQEDFFLGGPTGTSILNIEDLIRKTAIDRLYATVNVGSTESIKELGGDNPLPFIVLTGFTEETFHFAGVCNTDNSLDLVSKFVIDTNVLYQIVEEDNDEWDKNYAIIQYTESTSRATRGEYLSPGSVPYLYNEQLLNSKVIERFPLPSAVGVNLAPGFDDSFRAEFTDAALDGLTPWIMDYYSSGPYSTQQLGFDNDYTDPNYDVNNVWGSDSTPGNPVVTAESDFKASAQGAYVFGLGIVVDILAVSPVIVNPTFGDVRYQRVSIRVYANIYDASNTLLQTITVGDTLPKYLYGTYEADEMTFTVSLETDYRVRFFGQAIRVDDVFGGGNDPVEPQPEGNSDPEGDVRMTFGLTSWVQTNNIVNGGFSIPSSPAQTQTFSFERSTSSQQWLDIIQNPGNAILIDGNRLTYPLTLKRKVTGETSFETTKEP